VRARGHVTIYHSGNLTPPYSPEGKKRLGRKDRKKNQ
jgi:hypothetical protein